MSSEDQVYPTSFSHKRLAREAKTIKAMIQIYCDSKHSSRGELCQDCQKLLIYAVKRIRHCPFAEHKPTCSNCTVHCYKKDMRSRVREVMRFSGPKMIYHHPIMAIRHMIDNLRKPQQLNRRKP